MGNPRRGTSIAQVLIAAAIGAVIIAAITSAMQTVFKTSKSIDLKTQSQSFGTLMRLATADTTKCSTVLGLVSNPISIPTTSLPGPSAPASSTYIQPLPALTFSGSSYAPGTQMQNLGISSINLVISSSNDITSFPATIQVGITSQVQSRSNMTPLNLQQTAPLSLTMKVDPDNPANMIVTQCQGQAGTDASALCKSLGGIWLSGNYMPTPRCSLGSLIDLNMNEAPDIVPFDGGTSGDGERIVTCRYQSGASSSNIRNYTCPNMYNRAGYRCAFNITAQQWEVRYYKNNTTPSTLPRYVCTKGVTASTTLPDLQLIPLDTSSPNATDDMGHIFASGNYLPGNFTDYSDRLSTVKRCQYTALGDNWKNCTNADNVAGALAGQNSSCIYVQGTALYRFSPTENAKYQASSDMVVTPTSYTGWIYVYMPRLNYNVKTGATYNSYIREARGTPCYQVEIDTSAEPSAISGAPSTSPPDASFVQDPTIVDQCIYQAPPAETLSTRAANGGFVAGAATTPATRTTSFSCNNTMKSDASATDNGIVWEWTGAGTATPTLVKGSCWYFNAVTLTGYSASPWTGWVYLTANLPDAHFQPNNGTAASPGSDFTIKNTGAAYGISGVPCNGGVRVSP